MFNHLAKELYSSQQRILDHRPFLAGEIEAFRVNFETKRNDREVEQLFKSITTTGELKYDLSSRSILTGEKQLTDLSDEVNRVRQGVESFLANAKEEKPVSEKLTQSRALRAQRKETLNKDLEHEYQRVANSFDQKEEEIAELYSDLQIKLTSTKY